MVDEPAGDAFAELGPLTMDLEIDGHVATVTWTEQTATEG